MDYMIKRIYEPGNIIQSNRVLVIYGPRRVGKTTLLDHFLGRTRLHYKLDSGDNKGLFQETLIKRTSKELDLRNHRAVNDFFKEEKPDYVFLLLPG